MALFPCIIGSSGGTSIIDDGYYLLMGTSTPVSQHKITSGGSFQVTVVSGATKAALINCKNASASSLSITSSTATCYVIGIKNNKETYNAGFTSGSVSLSSYDYVLIIGGNGSKTFTFN